MQSPNRRSVRLIEQEIQKVERNKAELLNALDEVNVRIQQLEGEEGREDEIAAREREASYLKSDVINLFEQAQSIRAELAKVKEEELLKVQQDLIKANKYDNKTIKERKKDKRDEQLEDEQHLNLDLDTNSVSLLLNNEKDIKTEIKKENVNNGTERIFYIMMHRNDINKMDKFKKGMDIVQLFEKFNMKISGWYLYNMGNTQIMVNFKHHVINSSMETQNYQEQKMSY